MKVRPRLLIGSLIAAIVLLGGFAIYTASSSDGGATRADDEFKLVPSVPFGQAPLATNAVLTGKRLPTTYVRTESGDQLPVSSLAGKPLIINYWSSTCLPCKKELPDFVTAYHELGDKVRFVGVNAYGASPTEVAFAKDRGVDYEQYYDGDGRLAAALGLSTQPVTLFVAADGTIVKQTGQINLEGIRAGAEQLLG